MAALGMDDGAHREPAMFADHDGRPDPKTPAPAPSADDAERFTAALNLVVDHQNASASWLQRQMRIGYNQAARLVEQLESHGVIGPPNHVGKRDVLVPPGGAAHPALKELHDLCAKDGATMSLSIDGGPMIPIVERAVG
ncbi:DNA translocase FtsK [Sphingobium sp. Z007]|uniref:DNA translocase FtsK n=2 Tax=Sphingobium sp. Z007 TaxID=627495 RepID=UPI00278BD4DF|nr:DNA translocase FtsK [Sphingobium sp. Z007]